jgi:hypothetical protein
MTRWVEVVFGLEQDVAKKILAMTRTYGILSAIKNAFATGVRHESNLLCTRCSHLRYLL